MLIWRLAAVLFLFRWIFRDPKVDVRFLAAGVVIPDLIDLTVVTIRGGDSGQLWAHSLLAPTLVGTVVLFTTRRGRRRRAWMALVVAWLFHLLLDRMWIDAEVFLFPFFGLDLGDAGENFWPAAWQAARSDPWRWVLEGVGVVYLIWIWRGYGLGDAQRRRQLWQTGRLGNPVGKR